MSFNVDLLFDFSITEIQKFAKDHQAENFYAFAIDASLLCLNSEEMLTQQLQECQKKWERKSRQITSWEQIADEDVNDIELLLKRYKSLNRNDEAACLDIINRSRAWYRERIPSYEEPETVQGVRENTGDWAYQGFADLAQCDGFDYEAYEEHYYMSDTDQKNSAYGLAMDALVKHLKSSDAFDSFLKTYDFYAIRVEHNY